MHDFQQALLTLFAALTTFHQAQAQNLGIGITTPSSKLDVAGSAG